jgi:hypothetical protein
MIGEIRGAAEEAAAEFVRSPAEIGETLAKHVRF